MSRIDDQIVNPAEKFFGWAGDRDKGYVEYFDKSVGEKGEHVRVDLPFKFLVLDRVAQVTGGIDDGDQFIGFWSNAVKNLKTQKFIVRSKRGVEVQGLYDDIKGTPGVKFQTGLYIAYFDENKSLKIGYLKLKGAALAAWFEFTKKHRNIYDGAFAITGKVEKKKGSNKYYEPVFQHIANISDEADEMAKSLTRIVLDYLNLKFAQDGAEAEVEHIPEPEFSGPSDDPRTPFRQAVDRQSAKGASAGVNFFDNPPSEPELSDEELEPVEDMVF